MENILNFMVAYIYAIPLCLIILSSVFAVCLQVNKKRINEHLIVFLTALDLAIIFFSVIFILAFSVFYARIEEREFAVKKSCWKDGIDQSCIADKQGLYGTTDNLIFFSSAPIKVFNDKCKTSFGFKANLEPFCSFYDSSYVISSKGFDLKYDGSLTVDNTRGEYNSRLVIKQVLEIREKIPNFVLPTFIKEIKTEVKK